MPNIDAVLRLIEQGYSLEDADRRVTYYETEEAKAQHETWLAEQERKALDPYGEFTYIVGGKVVGRTEYLESLEEQEETIESAREHILNIKDILGWGREELLPAYEKMYEVTHKPFSLADIFSWESIAKAGTLGIIAVVGLLFVFVIVMAVK